MATKSVTVRLDDEQAERLERVAEEMRNSEAGVFRFALDLLYRTITEKGAVPTDGPSEAKPA